MAYDKMVDSAVLDGAMTATADAIRAKTGSTKKIPWDEAEGFAAAVEDVYDAGIESEREKFWGVFQNYGNPAAYYYAFSYERFTDENYNPKYDIVCQPGSTTGRALFYSAKGITDTKVPIYIQGNTAQQIFYECEKLHTVPLLHVNENTAFANSFNGCGALENITFGGTIGQDLSLAACSKLTHDSLMSVINTLKDYSGTSTTKTLTLHSDSKALLTDAEKAVATQKGWTIA